MVTKIHLLQEAYTYVLFFVRGIKTERHKENTSYNVREGATCQACCECLVCS